MNDNLSATAPSGRPETPGAILASPPYPAVTVPDRLLGYAMIAAVALRDQGGLLPQRHIIVLHNPGKPEERAYSTHYAAWQDGYGWSLCTGHYDLPPDAAITDLAQRAIREY